MPARLKRSTGSQNEHRLRSNGPTRRAWNLEMSDKQKPPFSAKEFRAELVKIMPGYKWTTHKSSSKIYLTATGTQSKGFNRISTLQITRTERSEIIYIAKSAGYGLHAEFLHTHSGGTLAIALRGLQDHYAAMEIKYRIHSEALKQGRKLETQTTKGSEK